MEKLSEITSKITAKRSKKRDDFADRKQRLDCIASVTETILNLKNDDDWYNLIKERACDNEWIQVCDLARTISDKVQNLTAYNGTFTLAKARADRNYVNFGAVGVTKEGKSEFTAQIAKLHPNVMPRRGGNYSCTTARINIINGESSDGKTGIVRVYYYSVSQMSKLLYSYLVELGDPNPDNELLKIKDQESLKMWAERNKDRIRKSHTIGQGNLGGKKSAFMGFLDKISHYVDTLIDDSKLTFLPDGSFKEIEGLTFVDYKISDLEGKGITPEESAKIVEEYYSSVSYFRNPDDSGKPLYKSYATRKAEIYTTFDVGKEGPITNLQFLDTPGIGEEKPGLAEILAKSVSSELDIILAIRAAKPGEQTDLKRNELITQLRTYLHGRPKSQQALYFIINLWNDSQYSDGTDEKNRLKQRLEIDQDLDVIKLSDSHFKLIQIQRQVEHLSESETNSTDPLQSYLLTICTKLLPEIADIDEEFFSDAIKECDTLDYSFESLKVLISAISHKMPNDDISSQINLTLKDVVTKWEEVAGEINDENIVGKIKYRIKEFCDQPTGTVLSDFLEIENNSSANSQETKGIVNFDENEDNYKFIDSYCKSNETAISKRYNKGNWDANTDFKMYSELKTGLLHHLTEDVFDRIDVSEAQEALNEVKGKFAKIFMEAGRLCCFEPDEKKWWGSVSEKIRSLNFAPLRYIKDMDGENKPVYLYQLFDNFASFSINYREILKNSIDDAESEYSHSDNFGVGEKYNFESWHASLRSIVHSLLCIEYRAQDLIRHDILKTKIDKIMRSFTKVVAELREVNIFGKQNEITIEREQWNDFYKAFAKEIFANDETEKKRALVSLWNELLK